MFLGPIFVLSALVLTLAAVGRLIGYIHHIPESINIMNVAAKIGDKLHCSVTRMLEEGGRRGYSDHDPLDIGAWRDEPEGESH
ncbi:DUF2254 family protein [Paracoccus sp. T5]